MSTETHEQRMKRIRLQIKEERNNEREEAKKFNASLNIPFKWQPAYKNPGDLLKDSIGMDSKAVSHIEVLEDFKEGRFSRKKGQFLCGSNKATYWFDKNSLFTRKDGNEEEYPAKITCKSCLKAAERWRKS